MPEQGHFVAPTLIADLDQRNPAVREEIFGPVLVVLPHDGDTDAIARANYSDYGSAGAVWSANDEMVTKVCRRRIWELHQRRGRNIDTAYRYRKLLTCAAD